MATLPEPNLIDQAMELMVMEMEMVMVMVTATATAKSVCVASEYVEYGNEESECVPGPDWCALCTSYVPEHFAQLDPRQQLDDRRGPDKCLELTRTSP